MEKERDEELGRSDQEVREIRKEEQLIVKQTKRMVNFTLCLAIVTFLLVGCMVWTILQQKGFNDRQLELYELSFAPQIYVRSVTWDSLTQPLGHNVIYTIENVANWPALAIDCQSVIDRKQDSRLEKREPGGLTHALFPGESVEKQKRSPFMPRDTVYVHFRLDYRDVRNENYYYVATYHCVFDSTGAYIGREHTDYGKLED